MKYRSEVIYDLIRKENIEAWLSWTSLSLVIQRCSRHDWDSESFPVVPYRSPELEVPRKRDVRRADLSLWRNL